MTIYFDHELRKYFSASLPLFDQAMALRGKCFRHQEGRMTQQIFLGGKSYFIKQHTGVGWKEVLKNLLQGRWPVLSAKNEWRAIEKLKAAGILVPKVVGYGQKGINPAYLQSFILMEELTSTTSLEEIGQTWRVNPPTFTFKKKLIQEVAHIARILHQLGVNHRDFYLCHFLLKTTPTTPMLYLIDLHRAQIRRKVPLRWRIKDLAGLYFSSKHYGLTRRDLWRFMQGYTKKSLREILEAEDSFWETIKNRGEQLYCDLNK